MNHKNFQLGFSPNYHQKATGKIIIAKISQMYRKRFQLLQDVSSVAL